MLNTELILNSNGSIYHLGLQPEDIAEKIIFVGDPDRVGEVTQHFDTVEFTCHRREFHTQTGYLQGQRITVLSTGIGTDNIDIVLNELDALVNIDFGTRSLKNAATSLKILRLGTCGGLQAEAPVGTIVHSQWAVGLDGLLQYYVYDKNEAILSAEKALADFLSTYENTYFGEPFMAACSPTFSALLAAEKAVLQGITLTAKGFYGPQGRSLGRTTLRNPQLLDILSAFSYENVQVTNLEMETSGILGLGEILGHECASLSVILANRPLGLFSADPAKAVGNLIEKGLELMLKW